MAEVAALCDRATILRDGVTVGVTSTRDAEERIVKMMLGAEVAKSRRGGRSGRCAIAHASRPGSRRIAARSSQGPRALEVRDLRCGHALSGVSFRVSGGEILGVAALEGQGQQELFDCIAGVRRADGGEILAEGRLLQLRHPADAIRAGLVLVPANRLHALLHAALDPRECRARLLRELARLGADRDASGATARRDAPSSGCTSTSALPRSFDASAAAISKRS